MGPAFLAAALLSVEETRPCPAAGRTAALLRPAPLLSVLPANSLSSPMPLPITPTHGYAKLSYFAELSTNGNSQDERSNLGLS